jgi:hypothetical protein
MAAYLFQIELPQTTPEVMEVIPEHRKAVNKLFAEGRILSYSLSINRDHIWVVINAEDEKEAMEIVAAFPLRKFFIDVVCHNLLFHNSLPTAIPGISLN